MKNQKKLIEEVDWDNLIILDASRFDYFKKVASNLGLSGSVERVYSPASNSYEWCRKVIEPLDFRDTIVLTANPFLNSKHPVKNFDARGRFRKIFDVWDYGWDEDEKVVLPEVMTEELQKRKGEFPDARLIAWYTQPHHPFLEAKIPRPEGRANPRKIGNVMGLDYLIKGTGEFLNRYSPCFLALFYYKVFVKILKEPAYFSQIKTIPAIYGLDKLRELYERNLEIALSSVTGILEDLGGLTVITSDHGTLLGDGGFGHFESGSNPRLHYVPWYEYGDF